MIAVIDYKAGNLKSVETALRQLGLSCRVTHDHGEILESDRIIFPGVGAAGKAMDDLKNLGLDRMLKKAFSTGKPILGICLGAQIIMERSEENNTACLGLIRGTVKRFPLPLLLNGEERLKIPHMGWNGVRMLKAHPLLEGAGACDEFYFVHSYYPMPISGAHIYGLTDYGMEFPSMIGRGSLFAMQFHPEKSGAPGLRILRNFAAWDGSNAE